MAAGADAERRVYRTRLERLTWLRGRTTSHVHGWFTVVFLVATFGPFLGWWATSSEPVLGWPVSIGWILVWMVLQTLNLMLWYATTMHPMTRRLERLSWPDEQGEESAS